MFKCPNRSRKKIRFHAETSAMKRAEENRAKLSGEGPTFIKHMLPTEVRSCLWLDIPSGFCTQHLPGTDTMMELVDISGKRFHSKYLARRGGLSLGWMGFSKAHNLEEGDILVFELVKKTTFKVYIIRHNFLGEMDGASGLRELDACAGKSRRTRNKSLRHARGSILARERTHIHSESSAMKQAEEVRAKLSAESPTSPTFVKYMRHTTVASCFWLAIPSGFSTQHLPCTETVMDLVDKSGERFEAQYLPHRNGLSSGWRDFSKAHNLKEGDALVFQLVKKTTFKVYIIRHNFLGEMDGASGELDACAGVMTSNDCEMHSNAFAKAQQPPLDSMLSGSPSNLLEDPDFVRPGLRRDEVRKHRSCKVHILSYIHGQHATCKEAEQIEDEYGTAFCFFDSIHHGLRSRKGRRADHGQLQSANVTSDPVPLQVTDTSPGPDQLQVTGTRSVPVPFQATDMSLGPNPLQATGMDTCSFDEHLESLWRGFPADKLVNFTHLECLWFELYRKEAQRTKVLSWIKKKKIFSRNYVFVPICLWRHWYLLILCNFGESLDSENKKPFMLLLDSLHVAEPMRLEQEIRKFVFDIYKEEGISDQRVSEIPLQVPKVPQQRNMECGFFALYFIKKFVEEAPETIFDCDVPFINQNWFGREEFNGFCIAVEKESKERSQKEMVHESDSEGDVVIIDD